MFQMVQITQFSWVFEEKNIFLSALCNIVFGASFCWSVGFVLSVSLYMYTHL